MQKRILLSVITILFITVTANAQITKGSILLGGDIGFTSNKTKITGQSQDNKTKQFYFAPAIGKAIKDNTIAGVTLLYYNNNVENNNVYSRDKTESYGGGLFIRRYVPVLKNFYIFGQGNADFTSLEHKTAGYNTVAVEEKGWTARISVYPGASYAINKKVHLETGFNNLFYIQYGQTKNDYYKTKTNSFGVGISAENASAFYIGFRLLLGK